MFHLVTIFNILAMVTGLFCLRKGGPVFLYLVLFLLILAFINENWIVLNCHRWWQIHRNVFYNSYSLAEMGSWFVIYYAIFHKKARLVIICCAGVNLLYTLQELFVTGSFRSFHSNSYTLFSACSLLISLLYIFKISLRDHHPLTRDPAFCLCSASICFHSLFLLNLHTMMQGPYWEQAGAAYIFDLLQSLATCTYHLLLCIAFIIFYYKSRPAADRRILS